VTTVPVGHEMNGTTLKFLLLAVMFVAAVWISVVSFLPEKEAQQAGQVEPSVAAEHGVEIPTMVRLAERLNDSEASVEDDLGVVGLLIENFLRRSREVPAGGRNEEIVGALRGRNREKEVSLGRSNAKLNEKGELLDRFGTPYYFRPVSDQRIEVRSAGPDRTLWTKDDLWLEDKGE
jgi:hypothetical protein